MDPRTDRQEATVPSVSVALARCDDYSSKTVERALSTLIETLGGWSRFLHRGDRVVIKPNLLMPGTEQRPITTHTQIIRSVFDAVTAEGGQAKIFDIPGVGSLRSSAHKLGFADLPLEEDPRYTRWKPVLGPFGEIERVDLEDAVVVNVAKLKTHGMMGLTLATKNLFGLVKLSQRLEWHLKSGINYDHFASLLVEIEQHVKPALNIIDAVVAMEGNGPSSGTARPLRFLAASSDALSLDAAVCRIIGMNPLDLAILAAARKLGIPFDDDPPVLGDPVEPHRIHDFQKVVDLRNNPGRHFGIPGTRWLHDRLRAWTLSRPAVDEGLCTGCGRCAAVCPMHAIDMGKNKPSIDLARCIRCFCCQELCPEGALRVRRGILSRFAWRKR